MQEKSNKSNQINLNPHSLKTYVSDKVVNTHEEKSEQTIPTKDNFHIETSTNNSNVNIMQTEVLIKQNSQIKAERDITEENGNLKEIYSNIDSVPVNDIELFEGIQKVLFKRNYYSCTFSKLM